MAESCCDPSDEEFSYFCRLCKKRYGKRKFHVFSSPDYLTCIKCDNIFKVGFRTTRNVQKDIQPHYCEVCGMRFRTKTNLTHHSFEHSNEWPYRCTFCHKGFAIRASFEKHMEKRDIIRDFFCIGCCENFGGKICPDLFKPLQGRQYPLKCETCSDGSGPIEYVKF
ncbi:hypothetical protein TNIN_68351 [Trichonephila inaurata madagascariensis]|uniref:C2H2-type domain-containing protein n=1 Tax=Trichonephila inaurata madagascariensis TaxID=2747483 RepID=A0A8X7C0G4_9ARAC|nr:hypothetical protein TNIN_68351 [Trichonephila inaurata madagascariensis]